MVLSGHRLDWMIWEVFSNITIPLANVINIMHVFVGLCTAFEEFVV